jgi:hypothetical protein
MTGYFFSASGFGGLGGGAAGFGVAGGDGGGRFPAFLCLPEAAVTGGFSL